MGPRGSSSLGPQPRESGHQGEAQPLQFIRQGGWRNDDSQESLTPGSRLSKEEPQKLTFQNTHTGRKQISGCWGVEQERGRGGAGMMGGGNVLKPNHSDG